MKIFSRRANVYGLLSVLLFSMTMTGFAQTDQASVNPPQPSNRAISEEQIDAFSKLQISLDKISGQYENKFAEAKDDKKQDQLQQEASEKMIEAIRKEGMTIAEYHRIAGAVIVDPETHKRVVSKLSSLQGGDKKAGQQQ